MEGEVTKNEEMKNKQKLYSKDLGIEENIILK
jgi:hypothetical protein